MATSLSHPLQQLLPLTNDRVAARLSHPEQPRFDFIRMLCCSNDDGRRSDVPETPGSDDMSDWPRWLQLERLSKAAHCGEWETAKTILDMLPAIVVNDKLFTLEAIHFFVFLCSLGGEKNTTDFMKQLVSYLPEESLLECDGFDRNLLHFAACVNKEAAELLVDRVPDLVYDVSCHDELPVHMAAKCCEREVLEYLMTKTRWDHAKMQNRTNRLLLRLFRYVVANEMFDIALNLIDKYPAIAITKAATAENTALGWLARQEVFSGQRGLFNSSWEGFLRIFYQVKGMMMKGENVNKHEQALQLVRRVCKAMLSSSPEVPHLMFVGFMTDAIVAGSHEIAELILKICPTSFYFTPGRGASLMHVAAEHRCEGIFNLVYGIRGYRQVCRQLVNEDGNNLLHSAAKLAPAQKLNQVSGAALQMQRELQWYKQVQGLVPRYSRHEKNKDHKTPEEVFKEQHKDLKKDGEKWMKDTAKSGSIAAVLIVTITFAAAITVPGGNKSDSNENKGEIGFPIFSRDRAFVIYAFADAVSLFASTASLLVFLSVLTSRFPEESFLRHHPTLLIAGLGNLFLSIASMMVAFAATFFLVLGRKTMWILGPTSAVGCLVVGTFAFLQVPLLVELVHSTFGPGIFKKKKPHIYLENL